MTSKEKFKARNERFSAKARKSARIRGAQAKRDRSYRYGGGK